MKITIVVPAHNEEKRISIVLKDLVKVGLPIIVVDDGSSDNTYEVVKSFPVNLLSHRINLGKGAALKTGCVAAFSQGADAVVIMDSDGQHKVEDLAKFVYKLNENNYDMIFGSRNLSYGVPFVRFIGNKFASVLVSFLFGIYVSDLICGFRAFTKKGYEKIKWQSSGYGVETEMVINVGKLKLKYCEVPVETVYYDNFKGVTILDAFGILFSVLKWRLYK
ncbi:MAG: glycosyltransferase family 2 protein [Candidatus Daviesbacteria bacterium]|nr:glycosyltransferase family 2 protein [Candidatus Daviesbacteria bacterium]